MDLEEYAKRVLGGKEKAALESLAGSESGTKLASQVDTAAMEKAAQEGDMKALSAMLRQILSTPEGQNFAREVQKAVGRDGR